MALDEKEVKELYDRDYVARLLLDHFAARRHSVSQSTVDRLLAIAQSSDKSIRRSDVVGALKQFDRLGAGNFKIGRRGQPSRIEWGSPPTELGRLAVGREALAATEASNPRRKRRDDGAEPVRTITHQYMLRPDLHIEINLPDNLTSAEAERLAGFIKTLPFDRE